MNIKTSGTRSFSYRSFYDVYQPVTSAMQLHELVLITITAVFHYMLAEN